MTRPNTESAQCSEVFTRIIWDYNPYPYLYYDKKLGMVPYDCDLVILYHHCLRYVAFNMRGLRISVLEKRINEARLMLEKQHEQIS